MQQKRAWYVASIGRLAHHSSKAQVFYDPAPTGVSYQEIVDRAGALPNPITIGGSRLVVHLQHTEETIDDFLALIRSLAEEKKAAGFVYNPKANGNANGNIYIRVN